VPVGLLDAAVSFLGARQELLEPSHGTPHPLPAPTLFGRTRARGREETRHRNLGKTSKISEGVQKGKQRVRLEGERGVLETINQGRNKRTAVYIQLCQR
jgi:hypothetical protein